MGKTMSERTADHLVEEGRTDPVNKTFILCTGALLACFSEHDLGGFA